MDLNPGDVVRFVKEVRIIKLIGPFPYGYHHAGGEESIYLMAGTCIKILKSVDNNSDDKHYLTDIGVLCFYQTSDYEVEIIHELIDDNENYILEFS